MGYIYSLTNTTNGKRYIGQTSKSVEKRIYQHIHYSDCIINKAIRKYGFDAFYLQTWEVPDDQLDIAEKSIIKQLDTLVSNGYNVEGGGCSTKHISQSTRKKLSEINKGKKLSEEHKKNISEGLKGKAAKHFDKENVSSKPMILIHPNGEEEHFNCFATAAKKYNLHDSHLVAVAKGKRKQHKGFHCKYVSQV
jgi:group I intron endonuclease